MLDVIQRNPEAAVSIINYLSHRLRESQDNAKGFALDRAEQRVAALLVNLAERSGIQEDNGLRISVRLTHQDLADMAGLTKETTSRIHTHALGFDFRLIHDFFFKVRTFPAPCGDGIEGFEDGEVGIALCK